MSSTIRGEDGFDSATALNRVYESDALTITSAGQHVLTHGLGTKPKIIQFELECISSASGYVAGDRFITGLVVNSSATNNRNNSVIVTDTEIRIRFSSNTSVFVAGNPTTGAAVGLANAGFKLYVTAVA